MTFQSINPYNGEIIGSYAAMSDEEIQRSLHKAELAYKHWRKTSFVHRADLMKKAAAILQENKEKFALLITNEMGKIINEARAEVEKCAKHCLYAATQSEAQLQDDVVEMGVFKSVISYDPIGCVFAVMPWNYPFWQVFRYAAPTIMAGNVTILKHAPNVLGCATAIANIFEEAGFPKDIFQVAFAEIPQVEQIIAADIVQGISLTGSEYAGSQVAALAGKYIKKSVLELGGSDPFIVLPDADIQLAVRMAVKSRMMNAGQACNAAKRFIVQKDIKEEFLQKFLENIQQLKQGNPLDDTVNIGPLARKDLATNLLNQINASAQQGAQRIFGGAVNDCNFQPTLLDNVQQGMPVFEQETFGPVVAIITAESEDEAIRLANQHRYGLAASIWTNDVERGYFLARQIDSGNVFINSIVRSDSRLPFGGVKKSGYGRELHEIGLKEFVNIKTVVIDKI
ncbi:MAG: NAD-dependent succinate-semialdehyde dehydrogenase [Saprospiraceae bacterium]|nr:NAD-dependent succinate-semialdehyde dehydrogenase [Saprospiraceae bacterium]MBP7699168.1 NAD-dependent succinate-semialdehyde dehydrogenase [Saprospiraceae bacterium]